MSLKWSFWGVAMAMTRGPLDDDAGEEGNTVGLDGLLEPKSQPPGQDALSIMNKTGLEEAQIDQVSQSVAALATGVSSRATLLGPSKSSQEHSQSHS